MNVAERYTDGVYLNNNPGWHAERSPWKASHVVRGLKAVKISPRTICDIGCGTGVALASVVNSLENIREAVGFEPSPNAPFDPEAQRVVDLRRRTATDCEDRFDVSIMLDVFEHVEDYFTFLKNCHSLADYHVFHIPLDASAKTVIIDGFMKARNSVGHLHYFTRLTALATLKDTGYDPIHWHFTKSAWDGPDRNPWSPMNLLRRICFRVSPEYTHRLLGGLALLVVARAMPDASDAPGE